MLRACVVVLICLFAIGAEAQLPLLPTPKSINFGPAVVARRGFRIENTVQAFAPVVAAFQADWSIKDSSRGQLIHIARAPLLAEEEYRIGFDDQIVVEASTPTGMAWALNTLGQLSEAAIPHRGEIRDKPDAPFRCLMVDVARRYHSLSTLRTLARWCQAGKVRYMQLHLTDDQNWMFPTKAVAGVDSKNTSGHPAYTRDELKALQTYAVARGVTIIPEIDMPGHSSLLTALKPTLFKLRGSPSTNCVNFGSTEVRTLMKNVLREVADEFPGSPFIHIGCDEAWYSEAERDPDVAAAMKRLGGLTPAEVFVDFVADMSNTVLGLSKTPLIWEGFPSSTFAKAHIPKGAVIVAWDGNSYPASKLIPDGFRVVNAGMDPYYIINHYPYELNTMSPLPRLYRSDYMQFASMNGGAPFKFQDKSKVLGSMLCWWEGYEWNAQELLPQRILAFGARLWNLAGEGDYDSFARRSSLIGASLSSRLWPFSPKLERQFADHLDIALPSDKRKGLQFAYRNDGLPPTSADIVTEIPTVKSSEVVTIQAFKAGKPVGETLFLPLKKVDIVPNLALHKLATASGDNDPQFSASRVTNGVSGDLTNYWLAYPNPQFLTIDLGSAQPISRIEVVAFWATGEPTHYRISISDDGKTWHEVVDASKQTGPSTEFGYVHQLAKNSARYVRLETLGGPLYPSSMTRINQIRVFGD